MTTKYVAYDPQVHKGLPLFEIVSVQEGDKIVTILEPSEISEFAAARIPWYFAVSVAQEIIKGGPESGHHQHEGRPGQVGGSRRGAWSPLWQPIKVPDRKIRRLSDRVFVPGAEVVMAETVPWEDRKRMMEAWQGYVYSAPDMFWHMKQPLEEWDPEAYGGEFNQTPTMLVADGNLQALAEWGAWEADLKQPDKVTEAYIESISLAPWNLLDSPYYKRKLQGRDIEGLKPREAYPEESMAGVGTALWLGMQAEALRRYPDDLEEFSFSGVRAQRPFYKMFGIEPDEEEMYRYPAEQARDFVEAYYGPIEQLKAVGFPSADEIIEAESKYGPPIIIPSRKRVKGGPRSGHRRHRGRPRMRGGSQPNWGTGTYDITISPDEYTPQTEEEVMRQVVDLFGDDGLYRFEYMNRVPDMSSFVTVRAAQEEIGTEGETLFPFVFTHAQLIDGLDDEAGAISREYSVHKETGDKTAYNDGFWMKPRLQAQGIGRDLYDRQVKQLLADRFDRVDLGAAGTIGRYAWARRGFDYAKPEKLDEAKVRFLAWLTRQDLPPVTTADINDIQSAYDMATFEHTDTGLVVPRHLNSFDNNHVDLDRPMHVGKAYMLDLTTEPEMTDFAEAGEPEALFEVQIPLGHGPWDATLDLKDDELIDWFLSGRKTKAAQLPVNSGERIIIEAPRGTNVFDDSAFWAEWLERDKGGEGSGYRRSAGHRGRPGQVGGSLPSGWIDITPAAREEYKESLGDREVLTYPGDIVIQDASTYEVLWPPPATSFRKVMSQPERTEAALRGKAYSMAEESGMPFQYMRTEDGNIHIVQNAYTAADYLDRNYPFNVKDFLGGQGVHGREAATYEVAKALGLQDRVPTAVLFSPGVSRQVAVPGDPAISTEEMSKRLARQAWFIDEVTNRTERESSGVIMVGDRPYLVDNEFAFPLSGEEAERGFLSTFGGEFTPSEVGRVERLLDSRSSVEDNIAELVGSQANESFWSRLERLKPRRIFKGGEGSGYTREAGHRGRPGKRGGSLPSGHMTWEEMTAQSRTEVAEALLRMERDMENPDAYETEPGVADMVYYVRDPVTGLDGIEKEYERTWQGSGHGSAGREVGVTAVAEALGWGRYVPQAVIKDKSSVALWVPDATTAETTGYTYNDGLMKGARQGFIIDRLTRQTDRHQANILEKEGRLFFPDNELSFPMEAGSLDFPGDFFTEYAHPAIRRLELAPSELKHIQQLRDVKGELELETLVGESSAEVFWGSVDYALENGRLQVDEYWKDMLDHPGMHWKEEADLHWRGEATKGGPGSGFTTEGGHRGRRGHVGGSMAAGHLTWDDLVKMPMQDIDKLLRGMERPPGTYMELYEQDAMEAGTFANIIYLHDDETGVDAIDKDTVRFPSAEYPLEDDERSFSHLPRLPTTQQLAFERDVAEAATLWRLLGEGQMFEKGAGLGGREVAYSEVAEALGWERYVPRTVITEKGSRSLWIPDASSPTTTSSEDVAAWPYGKGLVKGARQGFIMDRLMGQKDRHALNVLVKDDRMYFPDNELSFPGMEGAYSEHPGDFFARDVHPVIRRPELSPSELKHIQQLRNAGIENDLEMYVGEDAARLFWGRVDSALENGKIPIDPTYASTIEDWARTGGGSGS